MKSHAVGRYALCATAQVILMGLALTSVGSAQDADGELETVVVTGSRIATPELESQVPVTIVNTQAIEASGYKNVSDVLRELPSVGTAALSTTNSNFLTSSSGISTVNLRNLGDNRTLVLVNGRRFTPGVAGSAIVDLNMIPTDFIDHVEIVTGGASALYGSDAVAGVVNILYKKDFEGIKGSFQGGATDQGDSARYTGSLTFGSSLANGRGHFMLNLGYDKDEGLRSTERKRSAVDQTVTLSDDGSITKPAYSSLVPQGRFEYSDALAENIDNIFTFNPDGSFKDGFSTATDGFNRNAFRRISVPVNRTLVAAVMDYDLADHHQLYTEVSYGLTRSQSNIEPFGSTSNLFPGSVYGSAVDPATGDPIGMPVTNAYFQTLASVASARDTVNAYNAANPGDPINYIQFRRRLTDIAERGNNSKRQTWRAALGFRGDLPFNEWTYDASYVYGRTTDSQISTGQVNLNNFAAALDSVVDPDSGQIVCRDLVAQSLGCVPINVFGVNSITPDAANWVKAPQTRDVTIQEQVLNAYVTGPIIQLPAGPLSFVIGAEQRKDNSEEIWDSLTNLGLNGGNALPNISGSIKITEEFGEINVPILKDLPFAKSLDANAAYRHAHYSTVGSINTYKGGLDWAPIKDVRFRGVYSRAIRAPDINELYGGVSQTFPNIDDPCNHQTAATNDQFSAACRAIPGVANAIAQNGSFDYELIDLQSVTGFDGSNPALKQEKASTKTFGVVLRPSFLENFSMTVDYYNIKIKNAVGSITRGDSINQCLLTGDPAFCSNVTRNPNSGKITIVNAQLINVATIKTSGVETAIHYGIDLSSTPIGGSLSLALAENHLIKLEQVSFPGAAVTDNRGELYDGSAQTRLGAGFTDRGTLGILYTHGPISADWNVQYLSSIQDTLPENGIVSPIYNDVSAFTYHDVQLRYALDFENAGKYELYVGAKNVFNKKPPVLPSGMASEITGTETAADTYDVFGRFLYGGFTAKF